MKHKTILIVLLLCLCFNISGVIMHFSEYFIDFEIEEKEVIIIDKYTIDSYGEYYYGESYYMTGEDEQFNRYKITGNGANIGDTIVIYRNPNSANAHGGDAQWHISEHKVKANSICGLIVFIVFTIGNLIGIILYCKHMKNNQMNSHR